MIGGKGLKGNSWPDLDMLPFGWLTDQGNETEMLFLFAHYECHDQHTLVITF